MACYAHTNPGPPAGWQGLEEHLAGVAGRAGVMAAEFGSGEWGELLGWWHDLGKYPPEFQAYLLRRGRRGGLDHTSAGGLLLLDRATGRSAFPRAVATVAALAMVGHHGGLGSRLDFEGSFGHDPARRRLLEAAVAGGAPAAVLGRPLPGVPAWLERPAAGRALRLELWARMMLSALVDADRLDTEADAARFGGRASARPEEPGGPGRLAPLKAALDGRLEFLDGEAARASGPSDGMRQLKPRVLAACREAARGPVGCRTLTVPTGGGKTLASLAYALDHALEHGLRRVIVVVPQTTVIDQTAGVLRLLFGSEAVCEHHSRLDPEVDTEANRLAAENWGVPVVVTTSVQFFESLLGDRASSLRKLHNIARSVVVFDEVQALPHGLRDPICEVLNQLRDHYGCSLLFCTATQPALDRPEAGGRPLGHVRDVVEVIPDVPALYRLAAGRVAVEWPEGPEPMPWAALAARVAGERAALAIVHRRADARRLCELLPEGTRHLSAAMCAAHRRRVVLSVRRALRWGIAARLVSTTLIEAGVDISFPVVFRALGGLDALAQAAGRCNRQGELRGPDGRPVPGRLVVFRADSSPPEGLALGRSTTATLLAERGPLDLDDPATHRLYFGRYLADTLTDRTDVMGARRRHDFPEVRRRSRMIPGEDATVIVPYGDAAAAVAAYRAAPSRATLRALQPYAVTVPASALARLAGMVEPLHEGLAWLPPGAGGPYHPEFGLDAGPDPAGDANLP
jgi:CRISPR-associated endonuclease/helicase Cas3